MGKMTAKGQALNSRSKEPDERLLIEAAQKEPSRFAELYEHNFERVYAYIARRVSERSDAQDLTSHVFHQALKNLGRFQWRGTPFAAWLLRIAANAIADHSHRVAKEHKAPLAGDRDDFRAEDDVSAEDIEDRARLFRFVNRLPANQRRTIVMRFAEQKSIREIAHELRRTEGAVKQLQFRALQNLRTRLSDSNG